MITVITLPTPPSTNGLFSGTTRRHRSPKYDEWITEAGWELKRQRPTPVPGAVCLHLEVKEPTVRRRDLSNYFKSVEDLLVTHGVIEGDDQRFVRRIIMEWADIDGARITIKRL